MSCYYKGQLLVITIIGMFDFYIAEVIESGANLLVRVAETNDLNLSRISETRFKIIDQESAIICRNVVEFKKFASTSNQTYWTGLTKFGANGRDLVPFK